MDPVESLRMHCDGESGLYPSSVSWVASRSAGLASEMKENYTSMNSIIDGNAARGSHYCERSKV